MKAKSVARYSVVKFVPDRVRYEPVNVGLVVAVDDQLITRMADVVDPRIRLADPYADVESLRETLATFDAADFAGDARRSSQHVLQWLMNADFSNLVFTAPSEIAGHSEVDTVVQLLFDRLIARHYVRPMGPWRERSPMAARTALREAFASQKILGVLVEHSVKAPGASGIGWDLDFRYVSDKVTVIQTATTSLREDLRSKEHGFEAFAALIDVKAPGVHGILAADASPENSEVSGALEQISGAHGIEFVAGQRAFYELARRVRGEAVPLTRPRTMHPTLFDA